VSKETWNVLQEDESRSHLANDPGGIGPHVPRVGLSKSLAGDGEGRAGKSRRDDVDSSAPGGSVEVADVAVDRERARSQESFTLASAKDVDPVGVDLDGADGAPAEEVMGAEETAAGPCEEGELTHFTPEPSAAVARSSRRSPPAP
jgi:hypothetical protein